jgi:predicted secreted Zn-dependent protease
MKRVSLTLAACVAAALLSPQAGAASVSKTYSYFTIGGVTLEQIETELNTRGPHVNSTGRRHPGATQMEFTTRLGYTTSAKGCSLTKVQVTVDAKVILPRWRNRSTASGDTALVWDTLSADIKRHEESHVSIAKNHGRELEDQLKAIGRQKDCETVAAQAKTMPHRTGSIASRASISRAVCFGFSSTASATPRPNGPKAERHLPYATPSFFCRLVEDVVYWNTIRSPGLTMRFAA